MDSEFLSRSPSYVVFTEQEGSISVESDRSDSLLRSIIANDGYGLTSTWIYGNRFDYYHIGAGGTIGDSLLVTQNRGIEYGQADANADIWFAMLGDPTLRMHIISPPTDVQTDGVNVIWNASTDASVESYNVYRAAIGSAPGTISFERIGSVAAATNSFRDPTGSTSGYQYMVRAVKREDGPSGTYYNLSQGAFSHGVSPSAAVSAAGMATILPAHAAAVSTVRRSTRPGICRRSSTTQLIPAGLRQIRCGAHLGRNRCGHRRRTADNDRYQPHRAVAEFRFRHTR